MLGVFGLVSCALGTGFAIEGGGLLIAAAFLVPMGLLMIYICARVALPGGAYLRIDDAGIAHKWGREETAYAWHEIAEFGEARIGKVSTVGVRLRPERRPSVQHGEWDDTFNSYSMKLEPLLALLRERQHRAISGAVHGPSHVRR